MFGPMRFGPFIIFEKKSLSDPSPEEFAALTGQPLGTLDPLTLPAVQSCIRLLSEASASLSIGVERLVDATWTPAPEHAVAKLLASQPNGWTSTFDLVRDLVSTALTVDKGAVAFVNRVGDEIREIVAYQPGNVTVDYSADGRMEPSYKINNAPIARDDIIHIRGAFTRCPLSMAYDAIQAGKHMERHAKNLFENAARPGGVIETPKSIGDDGVKRMLKGWKAAQQGSENAGKTPILWDGAQFKQQSLNSTDAQFLENRKYQVLEICRAFRVPPSMIYELDRATWSNGEQQGKEFLTYSLEPWLLSIEAGMRRALFSADERETYRVRFDRDDLTRADLTARATAISSLRSSLTINSNEAREWLGLAPRAGGESFENPNTGSNQPSVTKPANDLQKAA
jgi:HK97 family phage portal protein